MYQITHKYFFHSLTQEKPGRPPPSPLAFSNGKSIRLFSLQELIYEEYSDENRGQAAFFAHGK